MELVIALLAASAPPRPEVAAAAAMYAIATAGLAVVRRACRRPRRRAPLRRCPLCAAPAVSALEYEVMDALQARVRQQCGQCGVWRRSVTALSVAEQHERTLEADRDAMRRSSSPYRE
jgi:hypothetical protein